MNYKSELRGFALDRAIRIAEVEKKLPTDIFIEADKIVNYLYVADKDIESHLNTLIPLFIHTNNVEKVNELILHLEQIKAEMEAKINKGVN